MNLYGSKKENEPLYELQQTNMVQKKENEPLYELQQTNITYMVQKSQIPKKEKWNNPS